MWQKIFRMLFCWLKNILATRKELIWGRGGLTEQNETEQFSRGRDRVYTILWRTDIWWNVKEENTIKD